MNIQEVLVLFLVIAAVSYTVYGFIQIFIKKPENSCGCSSCNLKTDVKIHK